MYIHEEFALDVFGCKSTKAEEEEEEVTNVSSDRPFSSQFRYGYLLDFIENHTGGLMYSEKSYKEGYSSNDSH